MKKIYTVIFTTIILLCSSGCSYNESIKLSDINDYDDYVTNVSYSREFMPDLSDLEGYESIDVIYYNDRPSTNNTHTINLIVTYSNEYYNNAKSKYLSEYSYLEASLYDPDNKNRMLVSDAEVEYNNYLIKVVFDEKFDYPKDFGMIGFNDIEYKLCFMFSYNDSLDYLNSYHLLDFIKDSYRFE